MRILQVNVIYGHGSTGKIVETLHKQYLSLGHESYVLFGRGKRSKDPNVRRTGFLWEAKLWRFIQLIFGHPLNGSPLSTWNLKRHIRSIRPDVVHVHCINGNMCDVPSFMRWLKSKNYRVVLTHHAKFMFTGGCGINLCDKYQSGCGACPFKNEEIGIHALDKTAKNLTCMAELDYSGAWIKHTYVSPWLMEQAKCFGPLYKADNRVVANPVSADVFEKSRDVSPVNASYVFFPSSVNGSAVKGSQFLPELAARLKSLGLLLVTTESPNEEIPNLRSIGTIYSVEEMARYYSHAKATISLSTVESFGLPVIESLLCGTPVVGFESGGPNSLETFGGAAFVEYGNMDMLLSVIEAVCKNPPTIHRDKLAALYSPLNVAQVYLGVYREFGINT